MEFKGTKGKWYWSYGSDTQRASLLNEQGEEICNFGDSETYYPTEGVEPNDYDALLISKAPEMFEMLKIYLADLNNLIPKSDAQRSRIYDVEQLIKEATTL